jgi:hypothetical protein
MINLIVLNLLSRPIVTYLTCELAATIMSREGSVPTMGSIMKVGENGIDDLLIGAVPTTYTPSTTMNFNIDNMK